MENEELAKILAQPVYACVTAPAGCGKTHVIAEATKLAEGKQLILTHTNRGIHAVKEKLKKLGVSSEKYNVETIASFIRSYARSYPHTTQTSELDEASPKYWDAIYDLAAAYFKTEPAVRILQASYTGIFADEHQDCTQDQHNFILTLGESLPLRLLGDPLQGIFDFQGDSKPIVDMGPDGDVPEKFTRYELVHPWRWADNPELGSWLLALREALQNNNPSDLTSAPDNVHFYEYKEKNHFEQKKQACWDSHRSINETVVVLDNTANECHRVAKSMNGVFQSDEEIYSDVLFHLFSKKIDQDGEWGKAYAILDLAERCFSRGKTILGGFIKGLESERVVRSKKFLAITELLEVITSDFSFGSSLKLMQEIENSDVGHLYRREVWHDAKNALEGCATNEYESMFESMLQVRNMRSIMGKPLHRRIISRTLLIKGLEFDCAVILNPEKMDPKNLYVALTRASKTLKILGGNPIITPK